MKDSRFPARRAPLGILVLALPALLGGCGGGGGGGGGRMFVLSCSLGCNSGEGGQDVTCGIVNTFVNQDIALQFSEPVDLDWVLANPTAFRVIDDATAAAPPGRYLLDPSDNKRLVFRPALTFSALGVPTFGFQDDAVYRIDVPGTVSGGTGPFVQSVDGKANESRVLCTITTSEGITDPIPGDPHVQVFVDELQPGGGTVTKEVGQVTGQVASTSLITLVFDDIMNLGTVITPQTQTAPFITIMIDPDGNLSDPSDQVAVGGVWTFDVDDEALTTTAVFTPTGGLPSGGSGQRKVVIDIPPQVVDLVDNSVANGGIKTFTPEVVNFTSITIPPGGEQFADQSFLDTERSSADWGESSPGFLLPGQGGGSGRLGELVVKSGQTVTLLTSPTHASVAIQFTGPITSAGSQLVLGDPVTPTVFFYKNAPATPYDIKRRNTFTSHALAETATFLNNFVAPDPINAPQDLVIEQATYTVEGDLLVITWDVPGTAGNGAFFVDANNSLGNFNIPNPLSSGGLDAISFGGPLEPGERDLVTNFDFQANPAGTPPPFTVDDGVYEFSRLVIEPQATLKFAGTEPARLFVRGLFDLRSLGLISLAGESRGGHLSNAPLGQLGGDGGPGGGAGGGGADRPDNTGSDLVNLPVLANAGIENPGSTSIDGREGEGVGAANNEGEGRGGVHFPATPPVSTTDPGDMEANAVVNTCVAQQVAGPGSGGAYAQDGADGVPMAINATALPDTLGGTGASNTPATTSGGASSQIGLPAPAVNAGGARTLDPDLGFLRGGSGGGGGGASVEQTQTTPAVTPPTIKADCIALPPPSTTPISLYRSHSGGGGGGGGGALQVQAGREANLGGVIDAGGGDGGSSDPNGLAQEQRSAPGGGGSGGGVLLQSRFIDVPPVPSRIVITGGSGGTLFDTTLLMDLSVGGDGSPGLVRAESLIQSGGFFDEMATIINPLNNVPDQSDPNDPNAAVNWLSVDTWPAETALPGAFSAGESCWYKPTGNFLSLGFADDSQGFGWDMDLILDTGGGPQIVPYRSSTFFGGNSPQEHWGELYAENGNPGAPIVVRFQGAKSIGLITDPCNIDPQAPGSPIDPATITQWVRHPNELNAFQPAPDMVRFLVLFDATHPDFGFIQGVTNLRITATPN